MGKLIPDNKIEKKHNIESIVKNSEVYKEICVITRDSIIKGNKGSVKRKFVKYYNDNHDEESEINQKGKVWLLVKRSFKGSKINFEPLQVASALDTDLNLKKNGFFQEIETHIDDIFCQNDTFYGNLAKKLENQESLIFYEIQNDIFLENYAPQNYKDIIFDMSKEYYVEASLAYYLQILNWKYYNSGMDKKSYYNIVDNNKKTNITKK